MAGRPDPAGPVELRNRQLDEGEAAAFAEELPRLVRGDAHSLIMSSRTALTDGTTRRYVIRSLFGVVATNAVVVGLK